MLQQISKETDAYGAMNIVIIKGDLSGLSEKDRTDYYTSVCKSLGLNPLTQPFSYLKNKKTGTLSLYARKDCTEQLRTIRGIGLSIVSREIVSDVYVVTARASDKSGRCDESLGAVPIKGLVGEELANAFMKAETKAKRRVTLSICGLGLTDESEVESIPNTVVVGEKEISVEPVKRNLINMPNSMSVVLLDLINELEVPKEIVDKWLEKEGVDKLSDMSIETTTKCIQFLETKKGAR